ncbi:Uncharacterized protein LW93_14852 [Fusarium fujikuroi]|nr:Uncharacterized protein LW93_14852 [Fusarium fujikuroi]
MSSLSRRACYKCGNVGHYAEVCSSAERLCYNCKQPGHESNGCPLPRTTEAKQCYHCQGLGHVQADCPTLRLSVASRKNKENQKGTGGTALIPFLKQARDETGEPAVEEWTRRFMKRKMQTEGRNDFFLGKTLQDDVSLTEDVEIKGLAGSWTMDDEIGGICQY